MFTFVIHPFNMSLIAILLYTKKESKMTTAQIMDELAKHYPTLQHMKDAVAEHRKQNPNWNWSMAAYDLLMSLGVK